MYMIRPRPVRSHQHSQLLQTEQFFQNGSLAWRYDQDDDDEHEHEYDSDSDSAPAYMDVGHFRWFWPWGVRRSSTFDTMPSGSQRLPVAALLAPSSITPQPSSLLLTRLPAELRLNIWRLVLQTRCSAVWTYDARSPAWRPDRRGAPYIDAALLRTCKAVYAETWDLPMRLTRAVLADGSPADKPGEWAGVVLAPGVLVPHAWQVLLLREAEVTMQHFRLEAGFLEAWVTALGKLKAAAATCVADLVRERREEGEGDGEGEGGGVVNEEVVRLLGERQPLEEIVVRMNRMDWWTWTSTPPKPWPESLPGECVADVRGVGRRKSRATRRTREEEEWEQERERWIRKDENEDGDGGDASSGQQTDEETIEQDIQSHDEGIVLEDTTVTSELSYGHVDDPSSPQPYEDDDEEEDDDDDDDDDLGGYFSDHTASSTASSAVYVFDAATLPSSLHLAPLATGLWDRNPSYGVLSPHLRITLMLETFGPKSLQLDAALAEAQTWRLPMPPDHHQEGRVLAWDGRPVREYHWLRDVGGEEAEGAAFLRMPELKATAEGVVVKMMTLVPRSA